MSPSNRRPRSPGRDGRLTLLAVTSFRAAGAIRSPALGPARVSEILDRAGQIAREAEVRYSGEVDPATPPAEVVSEWGLATTCSRSARLRPRGSRDPSAR